jgi:monomeric isocitrate dehydrogenase
MPRSYQRTPAQQKAYRESLKKMEEDLKKRRAEANKVTGKAVKPVGRRGNSQKDF